MNNRRFWFGLVGVAVVAVALFALWPSDDQASVPTTVVRRGDFQVTTTTRGELAAVNSVPIPAPHGWNNKVVMLIEEGTLVLEGDTLAVFDTTQQQQRVEERRTEYEGALADLENERATGQKTLAGKDATLKRRELALEQSRLRVEAVRFESDTRQREQELNLRSAELDVAEARQDLAAQRDISAAQLAKARAKVREEQLDLQRAERDLATLTLTAPDSGMVVYRKIWTSDGSRKVRVGDQVWQGQAVMELPDLAAFEVNTWVQEVDVHRLEVGHKAVVTVDALQDSRFDGEVMRIAPLARQEGDDKIKVFDVDVLLAGEVEDLLPGMTAQCRIIHQELADVVQIPLDAVHRDGDRTVVYLAGGEVREVTLGPASVDDVVVSEGLEAGDVLRLVDSTIRREDQGS